MPDKANNQFEIAPDKNAHAMVAASRQLLTNAFRLMMDNKTDTLDMETELKSGAEITVNGTLTGSGRITLVVTTTLP